MSKPSIILVHGAFADATGWQHVIPLLERQGYFVTAVQNPLKSLEDDIATTRRLIDAQDGRVVVVGHSYGGVVITGAAAGSDKVDALVYIAAFAPDAGEPIASLLSTIAVSVTTSPAGCRSPRGIQSRTISRHHLHERQAHDSRGQPEPSRWNDWRVPA